MKTNLDFFQGHNIINIHIDYIYYIKYECVHYTVAKRISTQLIDYEKTWRPGTLGLLSVLDTEKMFRLVNIIMLKWDDSHESNTRNISLISCGFAVLVKITMVQ